MDFADFEWASLTLLFDVIVLGHGELFKFVQGEERADGTAIKRPESKRLRPFRGVHSLNRKSSTIYDSTKVRAFWLLLLVVVVLEVDADCATSSPQDPAIFADEVAIATARRVYKLFCAEDIEDDGQSLIALMKS